MEIKISGQAAPVECVDRRRDTWLITWDKQKIEDDYEYYGTTIDHKPTIDEIKEIVLDWYNRKIDADILSGFKWNNIPVWLSMENQFNYKASYDLAVQSSGAILPTFKFGTTETPVYHAFTSLEELQDFYIKALTYVSDTLAEGWRVKDSIDWKEYEDLLK